jgi:hypothetical protein
MSTRSRSKIASTDASSSSHQHLSAATILQCDKLNAEFRAIYTRLRLSKTELAGLSGFQDDGPKLRLHDFSNAVVSHLERYRRDRL